MDVLIPTGVVRWLATSAAMLASCFSPELPPCAFAGQCELALNDAPQPLLDTRDDARGVTIDGAIDAAIIDGAVVDADVTPELRIDVAGQGNVKVGAPINATCEGTSCSYAVSLGTVVSLRAMSGQLVSWSGCAASANECLVVIGPATNVVVATFIDGG